MSRRVPVLLLALAACAPSRAPLDAGGPPAPVAARPVAVQPPRAERRPQGVLLHERQWVDDYAWLEKQGDPEVEGHLRLENAYADAVLAPMAPLRAALVAELRAHEPERDESVPVLRHGVLTWWRVEPGQEHGRLLARKAPDGPEQVLLDLDALARETGHATLLDWELSPDGTHLAAVVDTTGENWAPLTLTRLTDGQRLPPPAQRVTSVAWAMDGKSLFYTTANDAHRAHRLWRHTLAQDCVEVLVHEEPDAHFSLEVSRTRSDAFVTVAVSSLTTSEVRVVDAARPTAPWRVVLPRRAGVRYSLDHRGGSFFLTLNDRGPNFRLVEVPAAQPQAQARWVEWVPERADVVLSHAQVLQQAVMVVERVAGQPRARALLARGREGATFTPPAAHWSLWSETAGGLEGREFRLAWSNPATPTTHLAWDPVTGAARVLKVEPVPGFEASRYETERLEVVTSDGARVPVSLTWRRGVPRDGTAPLLLEGYGSYGVANDPGFSSAALPLLDRGVILATAHLRGGGEFGERWHEAAKLQDKERTFEDFLACAEFLVARRYTSPARLLITGASAGGLLMGAVLNRRPELFKAAYVEVPFVDVINTMLDESLPLTVEEFEEWGNPRVEADFHAMRAWSPVDNVRAQAYPAILVRAAYRDSQVPFHEPVKWVARLRELKTDSNPLLLKMDLGADSHHGASGRYQAMTQTATAWAFLLWQVGLTR